MAPDGVDCEGFAGAADGFAGPALGAVLGDDADVGDTCDGVPAAGAADEPVGPQAAVASSPIPAVAATAAVLMVTGSVERRIV
ncbi:hypothetical protein FCH28_04730 [Streptomyces piniterrae]|uniref:Uncharacterized protein n=1 Tax=Streptomyces piniterrae TaxID=2571125 RepID=A0A4U0NQZ6_9ACTN|nr:hypothetical protein [Streptomyces piniterrae]TJZ56830.1 hypothetical protein FCH28_04730 [Streptomyces piniterrae]